MPELLQPSAMFQTVVGKLPCSVNFERVSLGIRYTLQEMITFLWRSGVHNGMNVRMKGDVISIAMQVMITDVNQVWWMKMEDILEPRGLSFWDPHTLPAEAPWPGYARWTGAKLLLHYLQSTLADELVGLPPGEALVHQQTKFLQSPHHPWGELNDRVFPVKHKGRVCIQHELPDRSSLYLTETGPTLLPPHSLLEDKLVVLPKWVPLRDTSNLDIGHA